MGVSGDPKLYAWLEAEFKKRGALFLIAMPGASHP